MDQLLNPLPMNAPMDTSSTKAVVKSVSQHALSARASGSTMTFANPVEMDSGSIKRGLPACLVSKGNSTVRKRMMMMCFME